MSTPSMGHATRVGIGAAGGASTQQIEFNTCGIQEVEIYEDPPGIRDGRSHDHEGVAYGVKDVGGPLTMNPRADELDVLVPYILGGAKVVTTFPLAETIPDMVIDIDMVADVFRADGCKVNTATFSTSQDSQPMELSLDIQGKTFTGGQAFPAIAATLSDQNTFLHHQATVTLNSVGYTDVFSIELGIDNGLILDRYGISRTRNEIPEGDRIVTLTLGMPFSSTELSAFYQMAIGGIDGSVLYTNGGVSMTWTFIKLQKPEVTPVVDGRGQEIGYELVFTAREDHSAGTKEVVFDIDDTP